MWRRQTIVTPKSREFLLQGHIMESATEDLKMKAFEPEFAGKMNFYLSAVDDQLRHADDRPSIGLLLCKERDHLTVEYALRDLKKPIGVAQWQTKLVESLPKKLKGSLPTVAEIEAELDNARPK
jgi:hypothetical protein